MNKLNRRKFLTVAGVSSAVVTTGGAITLTHLSKSLTKGNTLTFRAVAGLPARLLPAYASYVIEGHVDLSTRSGVMTQTLYAGEPDEMSRIVFPGQSRIVRVTDVEDLGGTYRVMGVIDDRSQLQRGESSTFNILIDPVHRIGRASFYGSELVLQLEG
jgi:hypothetical protein